MALINCLECDKEISEQAKSCPNCGYSVKSKKLRFKLSKRTIIISLLIIAVVICGGIYFYSSNNLSEDEQIALRNVKDLKLMLKDSDSLKLNEDVLVIWYKESNEESDFYTYINYGAKNGFGAMDKDIAMYKGYKYIGDYSDVKEVDFKTDKGADLESKMELISARLPYLAYQAKNAGDKDVDKLKEVIVVNSKKLMKNIE